MELPYSHLQKRRFNLESAH